MKYYLLIFDRKENDPCWNKKFSKREEPFSNFSKFTCFSNFIHLNIEKS